MASTRPTTTEITTDTGLDRYANFTQRLSTHEALLDLLTIIEHQTTPSTPEAWNDLFNQVVASLSRDDLSLARYVVTIYSRASERDLAYVASFIPTDEIRNAMRFTKFFLTAVERYKMAEDGSNVQDNLRHMAIDLLNRDDARNRAIMNGVMAAAMILRDRDINEEEPVGGLAHDTSGPHRRERTRAATDTGETNDDAPIGDMPVTPLEPTLGEAER